MPLLSICLPTKRPFSTSRNAIEQALVVADLRDSLVVLSDNSGDPEKRAYWENRSPRIVYHPSKAGSALENFLEAVSVADTPFVLALGDDDGVSVDPHHPAVDLGGLPADYMGVRPLTHVHITGHGVLRKKDFGIDGLTPTERIREFSRKAGGDNSAFYSIYRREPYRDLLKHFVEHHPVKANFIDWALSLALFGYGRMAYDPGLIYHYNADQWASPEKTKAKNAEIFEAAGLPPHTDLYQPLIMAIDLFVFVARPGTPLTREDALDAVTVTAGDVMNGFINTVMREPEKYPERIRYLSQLVQAETDAFARFQLGLLMLEDLKPGLKDAYVDYFRSTMSA